MPKDHAGQGFDLDIGHRIPLRLREIAHLRLRELDVLHVARRDTRHQRLDLAFGQPEGGRGILVELFGKFAHRRIAARLDIRKDRLDRSTDLGIILGAGGFGFSALQIGDRHCEFPFAIAWCAGRQIRPGCAGIS